MKTIIAGSRSITDYALVVEAVRRSGFEITEVVSGCARGADELGERWAVVHQVPITQMPADWDVYGRSAGHLRNAAMVAYAEAAIVVWNGQSPGSAGLIRLAEARGLPLFVLITDYALALTARGQLTLTLTPELCN